MAPASSEISSTVSKRKIASSDSEEADVSKIHHLSFSSNFLSNRSLSTNLDLS